MQIEQIAKTIEQLEKELAAARPHARAAVGPSAVLASSLAH
jgi:hypothetical protein